MLKFLDSSCHVRTGIKHSKESIDKISKSKIGKNLGKDNPFAKKIICNETGEIFGAVTLAVQWYKSIGFHRAGQWGITDVLKGRSKKYHNYSWSYYKD